jgi:phosphatidylserine/phosphatidylglycerophosphate/cardiolipin synthase-like enzyme
MQNLKTNNWLLFLAIILLVSLGLNFYFILNTSCLGCNAKIKMIFSPFAQDKVLELIREAKETIDIEVYSFTSEEIAKELIEAKKRGVKVRVILEPRLEDNRKFKIKQILEDSGIEVRWASLEYKLTHSKFIIIDRKKILIGSINLSASALEKNREAAVVVESEKVKEVLEIFEEDWQKATE